MEQLDALIDFSAEKPISKVFLRQIMHGGERKRVCFVATEFFIRVFEPQTIPDKDLQEVAKYPMCDITKMDCIDEVTFRITFGQESVLTFTDAPANILSDIFMNLKTIELQTELPCVDKSVSDQIKAHRFNAYGSVMQRYRAKLAWSGEQVSADTLKSVERLLKREPKSIDLGVIQDLGFNVPVFLDAIEIQPLISGITVPPRPQSKFYEALLEMFGRAECCVSSVAIVDAIDDGFYEFIHGLGTVEHCTLREIRFENMEVPDRAIEAIQGYLGESGKQLSLGFTKCDISECEERTTHLIEQSENLIGVNMTTVWLPSALNVKTAIARLQKIAIRGCGIQIAEVLGIISRVYAPRVTDLDLSKNQCTEPIKDMTLPASLRKITVDSVKWKGAGFTALFRLACNLSQGITFSCVRAQMVDRHWQKFFQALDTFQDPQLVALIWNENQIHAKLCQFLQKARNLAVFCMGGCKVLSDAALQKLLENHKSLLTVDMHGTPAYRLGPAIRPFLSAVKKSKSIRRLDVSHCKMGSAAFAKLVEVINSNTRVKQVLLDDNDLPNFAAFEPLCGAIQARAEKGILIHCRFPWDDMIGFAKAKTVSPEKISSIKSLFLEPEAPKSSPGWEEWLRLMQQQYPEAVVVEDAKQPIPKPEGRPVSPSRAEERVKTPPLPKEHSKGIRKLISSGQAVLGSRSGQRSPTPDRLPKAVLRPDTNIQMDFFEVRMIENDEILERFNETYSLEALSQRILGNV